MTIVRYFRERETLFVREELVKGKFLRQSINLALLALALVSSHRSTYSVSRSSQQIHHPYS